ncbi:MAG: hypothetical protein RLZZ432_931 [Chloroflexota bacterium]
MRESRIWASPVLASTLPVAGAARHVQIDEEALRRAAGWMAYEEFAPVGPAPAGPFDVGPDPARITAMTMLVNTLNFAFTDFATSQKFEADYRGAHYVDSEAMVASLHRAIEAGEPLLDGAWAARATRAELARIFRGSIEMPMLDDRAQILNEVGATLVGRYGGSWRAWVDSCAPSLYADGDGLLERLAAEFPRFDDASDWRGERVRFMKLAQLGLWSLHLNLSRVGGSAIEDPWLATAFADYIVPVALRVMGIMHPSPALAAAIDEGREVPRDSEEEVELRALSIYAVARLTDEINALRPERLQLVSPQVDYRLWKSYHATHHPHHLTRTVMY